MKVDSVVAGCTCFLAGVYLYATSRIPTVEFVDPMGPKAFPILLGILLMAAGFSLWIDATFLKPRSREKRGESKGRKNLWVVGAVACWTLIYYMFFEQLGYLLSSSIYLYTLLSYFNRSKWLVNAGISVLFTFGFYALLVKVLQAELPRGLLYF